MGRKQRTVKIGYSLAELANTEEPPVELKPRIKSLRNAGATEVILATMTPADAFFEASTAEVAKTGRAAVVVMSRRVTVRQEIPWDAGTRSFQLALDELVRIFQGFDKVCRFRFAASDMRLAAGAAEALIDARDADGPARLYDRIIETGMVVTYARPFLESNEAGIGRTWWPTDAAERKLHDELIDLRNEYYAHAAHTPQRLLENTLSILGKEGRPVFAESWTELPTWKLREVANLADRQAVSFQAEGDRLDVDLFGPRDDSQSQ
jgi:hypothetical protein